MDSEMNKLYIKKYRNYLIEYCFALLGPEFDQCKHPLLLEDSTPKRRPTNTKEYKLYKIAKNLSFTK